MGYKDILLIAFYVAAVSAQSYRVCVTDSTRCQSLSKDDSQVQCLRVESRVDCALKLAAEEADLGFFTEEETLLLGQQQPNNHRVIATVRDTARLDPYAFEAVAVVPSTHSNGLEGLRGGVYCHPGLGHKDVTWSPRVLKTLEVMAARTDRCPNAVTANKTAEELEVETLSQFFSAACRPGVWSANASVDIDLRSRYSNLCSLCGDNNTCTGYNYQHMVSVAGVRADNPHIQSLECLRLNSNNASRSSVAFVAWQHAREYFTIQSPQDAPSFAVLCTDGTIVGLTNDILANTTSPCAFVRQPWATIVAAPAVAPTLLTSLRSWWPNGTKPTGDTWQSILFTVLARGDNARVFFEDTPISPLNYTQTIREIASVDSSSCLPARKWCVTSANELAKCNWVRSASFILGLQPPLACQLRSNVIECLADIKGDKADFISAGTNYGYLARVHYQLRPVKLVQNSYADAARVAAFVKESLAGAENISRFENLRGKKACFPEFGGLAYISFVRAGRERGVLPDRECDYARVVGEFFNGACAPGAIDASHALTDESTFNADTLCSSCQSSLVNVGNFTQNNATCAWDYSNLYYGNNGSLACLADANNDVAFLNTRNISRHLESLNLQPNQFRALCRNNSLAVNPGVNIDDGCLLAFVVDAEVLTRRADPLFNSLNVLLDWIDQYFGYTAASGNQLINFEIFSPFGGNIDLLFKDSTIDLTEPSLTSTHVPARNYMELFEHLDTCSGAPSFGIFNIVTIVVMALIAKLIAV